MAKSELITLQSQSTLHTAKVPTVYTVNAPDIILTSSLCNRVWLKTARTVKKKTRMQVTEKMSERFVNVFIYPMWWFRNAAWAVPSSNKGTTVDVSHVIAVSCKR